MTAAPPPARRHLDAVDLVRVLTIALVVAVHTLAKLPTTVEAGAVTVVLHVSREIFFLLTAFVLTYAIGQGPVGRPAFWRRRYLFVGVPYVVWSAVYFVAGNSLDPLSAAARVLGYDLLTGSARYHLYFLLVSMQLYLAYPAIRWLLRATRRHHRALLAVSALAQLAIAVAVQGGWAPGEPLTTWLRNPDALLVSYPLYVIAGGVAAWHIDRLMAWTRRNTALVLGAAVASAVAGVAVYATQVGIGGQTPTAAAAVFQPVVVVESMAIAWAFLAVGLVWVDRGMAGRRPVRAASDASFGIYLAHPLVLQGLFGAASAAGLVTLADRAPAALVVAVTLVAAVPVLYAATGVLAALARRTPLSLALTGRPWRRRERDLAAAGAPAARAPHATATTVAQYT